MRSSPPTRTCTTCRCRLPPSAACRPWRVWLWFIGGVVVALAKQLREPRLQYLAAAGLAAVVSMLAAGMFEYNFGDSEFLMLFLILVTLPFAAARQTLAVSR